jgi:Flp pilus assembly protein TadG
MHGDRPVMTARATGRLMRRLRGFAGDTRGVAAVEFALVGLAFITILLAILQFAMVFLSQMLLHDALSDAASGNSAQTYAGNRGAVAAQICSRLVLAPNCVGSIRLEAQPLAAYGAARQPVGGTFTAAAVGTPMLMRARVPVVTFVPGLPDLSVSGAALYARQS